MRLIDADELLEELNSLSVKITGNANASALSIMRETKKSVAKMIDEQPTAYDVDKVVGQLEEKIIELKDQLMYAHDEDMAVRLRCKMHGLDEAIEVMKAEMKGC